MSFLPNYTILLPLYKESDYVAQLVNAVKNLNYPVHLLQVLILLEQDDTETLSALTKITLPKYFFILSVPQKGPKTKGNACNYGLSYATGKYLVIYDAEDIPERNQLIKAVKKFDKLKQEQLACIQAELRIFRYKNIISKCAAIEYLIWFVFLWPKFSHQQIPVPLGGTSNHFKVSILQKIGGWDPYNVTEDADMSYRLSKNGYKILPLDSVTCEESVYTIKCWIRQRSRWLKGHMITFLVHSRSLNIKTSNQYRVIFSLYYFMFLPSLLLLYSPFGILYFFKILKINYALASIMHYISLTMCFIVYFTLTFLMIIKRRQFGFLFICLIYPIYLLLYIPAAYYALIQLIIKPYYWEKTIHKVQDK